MNSDSAFGVRRLYELFKSRSMQPPPELALLEARLRQNEQNQQRYGGSENSRAEWAQIIDGLIQLAYNELGVNFNDLCQRQFAFTSAAERKAPQEDSEDDEDELPPAPNYAERKNWAIIVGIDTYEDQSSYPSMQVCAADAMALARQFAANGFLAEQMQILTDRTPDNRPTRGNILTTLKTTAAATSPDDLLLFYYSGHGDAEDNESYLVSCDGWASSLEDTAIPFSLVKHIIKAAPARSKVIILDACHIGAPLGSKGKARMSPSFMRHVFEQAEGIAVLSSCTQNQYSYQWKTRGQSTYTYFLLQALQGYADKEEKGVVTVRDLNNYVTDKVKAWAAQQRCIQSPTISSEMVGEIVVCSYPPNS